MHSIPPADFPSDLTQSHAGVSVENLLTVLSSLVHDNFSHHKEAGESIWHDVCFGKSLDQYLILLVHRQKKNLQGAGTISTQLPIH